MRSANCWSRCKTCCASNVLMLGKVHTDDIPVPVQEPGSAKPARPGCGLRSG
ncbi:hypothetical protein [Pantoea agglomerans]|uniref:hypothetical protein n=1 Tax=Enterobacter agglomerans TaxID=549 RepID=UPI001F435F11|nr:hypothetical protein [Pantoea agglomerans]